MDKAKDPKTNSNCLAGALKAAVWFAVLGFIVLAVEAPHWSMAPDMQRDAASTSTPASAASATDYFPARFPAPKGEPEVQPPTF